MFAPASARFVGSSVPPCLSGDDMLYVKAKAGEFLRQVAVFAATDGALAHTLAGRRVHSGGRGMSENGLRFRLE